MRRPRKQCPRDRSPSPRPEERRGTACGGPASASLDALAPPRQPAATMLPMPNIGPMEIILLLGLALLLFGAKRLPEIGRSLGSGMREFKDSVTGDRAPEPRSELPPPVPTAPPASPSDTVPA